MLNISLLLFFIVVQGGESGYHSSSNYHGYGYQPHGYSGYQQYDYFGNYDYGEKPVETQVQSCKLNYHGKTGSCKIFSLCDSAQYAYFSKGVTPVFCDYNHFEPIVCCDLSPDYNSNSISSTRKPSYFDSGYFYPKPSYNGFTNGDIPSNFQNKPTIGGVQLKPAEIQSPIGSSPSSSDSGIDRAQQGPQLRNCRLNANGGVGACRRFSQCPEAQAAFNNNRVAPIYCEYDRTDPIVCCPSTPITTASVRPPSNQNGQSNVRRYRVSAQICREIYDARKNHTPIVGGDLAKRNEFPYMCPIGYRRAFDSGYDYKCGGTLISADYILSAAHCASIGGASPDVARVGSVSLSVDDPQFPDIPIGRVIVHPEYNRRRAYNDIALFQLGTYNQRLFHRAACLWTNPVISIPQVTAIGFGVTQFAGQSSNDLLKADLRVYSNQECNGFYPAGDIRTPNGIIDTQVCAGDPQGVKDTCQGDSGGPIITRTTINGTRLGFVLGITSFGQICASGTPGVYTRVSSFLDWIESVVWPNRFG